MKKWMYVISVGSMLAIFLFFYLTHMKETEILEQQKKVKFDKEQLEIAETKARNEAKAREDARTRAAARAAEEAKKEADKIAKWEAEGQKIKDQTDTYNREADRLSKDSAKLEIELDTLRNEKEKVNRATFEIAKRVESVRIDKQNAELETQRMTEMIARRASDSSLARMPAPVVQPKSP
jgi:chromosome segregation ATPase